MRELCVIGRVSDLSEDRAPPVHPALSCAAVSRLLYIDWLRGVAVLFMVLWHSIDAWTLQTDRESWAFTVIIFAAGWAAPLFLLLAGVSVSLAAGSRVARGRSRQEASWELQKRGWQIFLLAHVFRFQSFHMYGIMMSAMLVGIVSIQLIKRLKARTLSGEPITIAPKVFQWGNVIGGLIFGLGWALVGACPGPLYALVGSGVWVIGVSLAAAVAGISPAGSISIENASTLPVIAAPDRRTPGSGVLMASAPTRSRESAISSRRLRHQAPRCRPRTPRW